MRRLPAILAAGAFTLLAGCSSLPGGGEPGVSPEAQLVAICTALAGLNGELARQIDAGALSDNAVERVRYLKPIADEACLEGIDDPVAFIGAARQALVELEALARENSR